MHCQQEGHCQCFPKHKSTNKTPSWCQKSAISISTCICSYYVVDLSKTCCPFLGWTCPFIHQSIIMSWVVIECHFSGKNEIEHLQRMCRWAQGIWLPPPLKWRIPSWESSSNAFQGLWGMFSMWTPGYIYRPFLIGWCAGCPLQLLALLSAQEGWPESASFLTFLSGQICQGRSTSERVRGGRKRLGYHWPSFLKVPCTQLRAVSFQIPSLWLSDYPLLLSRVQLQSGNSPRTTRGLWSPYLGDIFCK